MSDKSGHGNHASVTGTAPTYDASFFGGMGSVRFDADPEAMRVAYTNTGGLFGNGDSTFIGVIRRDTLSNGSSDDWLWQVNGNDRPRINWSGTGPTITTNSQDFGAIVGSETRVDGSVSLDVARDAESILFIHSTGNWESRETGFLTLGNRAEPAASGDRPFDGNVAELIFFNNTLSGDDQLRLEGYLAHKWGLEGSLPVDHIYKAAAPMAAVPEGSTGALVLLGLLVLMRMRHRR